MKLPRRRNMNRTLIIAGLIVSLLWGCSLAPQYTRPQAPVPAQWPSGPAYQEAGTGKSAAEVKWEDFFQSEPLRTVIGMALANNRDLRVAVLNIERYQALYR